MAGPNDLIRKNVDGTFDVYVQIQDGTEYDGNYPDFGEALDAFKSSSHILNHYVPPLEKVTFYDAAADHQSSAAEALASWIETCRLLADQLQQAAKEILAQVAKAEKAPAVAPLIENGENLEQAVRRRRRRDDGEIALAKCNDLEDELEYQRKLIDRINEILTSPWSDLQHLATDTYRHPFPVHPKDVKENQG